MNPPPALVTAFAEVLSARLDALAVHNHGRVVIRTSESSSLAASWLRVLDRVAGANVAPEPFAGRVLLTLRADGPTVSAALREELPAVAAELAAEAYALACRVLPAELVSEAVATAGPDLAACWPRPDLTRWPLWAAEGLVLRWPKVATRTEAAADGRALLQAAWDRYLPALRATAPEGSALLDWAEGGAVWDTLIHNDDDRRDVVEIDGLAALYVAERRELWRTRATFAAGEAYRAVRAVVAEDPGPEIQAAVRAVLHGFEESDPEAAEAAASAPLRGRYAGELLQFAGTVLRPLFAGEPPTSEDAARATVDTAHGPALRWDVGLADLLAALGANGRELAEEGRRKAAERTAADRGEPFEGQAVMPGTPLPPAGVLWRLWFDPDAPTAAPPRWLARIARALWLDRWKPALKHGKAAAVSMPALFAVLSIRGGAPVARTWHADGRALAELRADGGGFPVMHLDMAGIPASIADRLLGGDLGPLRGRAGLAALDTLVRSLDDDLRRQPYDGRRVPKVAIPAGRGLAEACGMPNKGTTARDLDEAVQAWAAVVLKGPNGALLRFLLSPEYRAAAPGRPAAWLLTPGELLLPTGLTADASKRARHLPRAELAYRRLVPWPDVRAPDDYARDRDRADADALALALVLTWAEQATAERGRAWQARPGVIADDAGWRALVARAHADGLGSLRTRALDALGDAGWVTVDGDRVAPGPALPRLAATLNGAARGARDKAKPKKKRA